MSRAQKNHSGLKKHYLAALAIILFVVLITILELTNTTHFFHENKVITSANSLTKGESAQNSNKHTPVTGVNNLTNTTTSNNAKSAAGTNSTYLITPSGNFVSNHHPNLSGSPAPNLISSVCTTTPGATCTINFTQDGITKSLATETADSSGTVYWTWKLQDTSLTTGSWQIQAVANLNGQTKTATDPMELVVSP